MKTNFRFITICIIVSLSLFTGKANAINKEPVRDSICCNPDSLKVVSTNFPVFCVSWRVSTDSICKRPYGFEVQWRQFPGNYPWTSRITIYTGGAIVIFCDFVTICGGYQWRVRALCDSITGNSPYSDWIYGNKFAMTICVGGGGDHKIADGFKNTQNPAIDKTIISNQAIKPKEN